MTLRFRLGIIFCSLLLAYTPARAQWVCVSPPYDVQAIVGNNGTLFVGAYDSNYYFSTNNGSDWSSSTLRHNDGFGPGISSFAISNGNIFAGTGFDGVFLSTNNGSTWSAINNGIPPLNQGYITVSALAAMDSNVFLSTYVDLDDTLIYLYRSTNNGTSWMLTSSGIPELPPNTISNPEVQNFYVYRTKIFAVTDWNDSVFQSTDNGASWSKNGNWIPQDEVTAFSTCSGLLFASTASSGVWLSTDSGGTWTSVSSGLPGSGVFPYAYYSIASLASDGTNLFAAINQLGIYMSTNKGASWENVTSGLHVTSGLYFNTSAFAVLDTNLFIGVTDSGVWRRSIPEMIASLSASSVTTPSSIQPSIACYPNPCSEFATISFTVPAPGVGTVAIRNLLGADVSRIYSGPLDAGDHTFVWNASTYPSGIYECVLEMNGNVYRRFLSHF